MKQFKYIPFAILASLGLSSCNDFLEKDSQDSIQVDQYLTNDDNLMAFTNQIYGPFTWDSYQEKFAWCANELTVGNVYHNYADEGAFFFLKLEKTNANLLNGYQGLYGVISRCNMIIHNIKSDCGSGVSEEAINRAIGEAKMFRGMCYFLIAEYWGKGFIVLNNENNITSDKAFDVPMCSRNCLFAQAEKDWKEAADLLPEKRWGKNNERCFKASAYGMLAKLYLTEAAASVNSDVTDPMIKFTTDKSFNDLNDEAINYANLALGLESTLEPDYEQIFWPKTYSKEILFGLHFEQGAYGAGSARQINFARSKHLAGGDDYYGGEKGITLSLFNSWPNEDKRKKATSYYTILNSDLDPKKPSSEPKYNLYDGSEYVYYVNPKQSFDNPVYGDETEAPCLNNIRKFVYSVHLQNKFSAPLSIPFLRVADLHMIKAEAKIAKDEGASGVTTPSTAGNADLDELKNAGRTTRPYAGGIAMLQRPTSAQQTVEFDTTDNDGNVNHAVLQATYEVFNYGYDLFTERRYEFALECQNWFDLKRIYYRNAAEANNFVATQDRGWIMGHRYGAANATSLLDYQRRKELSMIEGRNGAKPSTEETPIDANGLQWFFPLPGTVQDKADKAASFTDEKAIRDGNYNF